MDTATGLDALRRARDILGSEAAIAAAVGVAQPSVNYMLNNGKRVPAEWCIPLETATREAGTEISRAEFRPDLFGPDVQRACSAPSQDQDNARRAAGERERGGAVPRRQVAR